jgi:hypothetical protein
MNGSRESRRPRPALGCSAIDDDEVNKIISCSLKFERSYLFPSILSAWRVLESFRPVSQVADTTEVLKLWSAPSRGWGVLGRLELIV